MDKSTHSVGKGKRFPHLYLEITRACNLFCPHCFNYSSSNSEMTMSLDDAKLILNNFVKAGGKSLQVTGGESFTHKNLFEILEYARDVEIEYIILSTNGTLCSREDIKRVHDITDEVYLSIDGFERENDRIRGKGGFIKTCNVLDELIEYNHKVSVYTSLTPLVFGYIEEFVEWLIKKGVYFVNFSPIGTVGRGQKKNEDLHFSQDEYGEIYQKIRRLERKYVQKIRIAQPLTKIVEQIDFSKEDWVCNPKGELGILIGGDICDEWILGNAKEEFVFSGEKLKRYIKIMNDLLYNYSKTSECQTVHVWELMVNMLRDMQHK